MCANRGQHIYVKINLKFNRIICLSLNVYSYPKHWYQPPISIFNAFSYSADGWKLKYWVKCAAFVTKYKSRNLILKMASEFNFCALWFTWALLYTFWIWLPVLFLLFIFIFLVVYTVQFSLRSDMLFFNLSTPFFFSLKFLIGRLEFRKAHFHTRCSRPFGLV